MYINLSITYAFLILYKMTLQIKIFDLNNVLKKIKAGKGSVVAQKSVSVINSSFF